MKRWAQVMSVAVMLVALGVAALPAVAAAGQPVRVRGECLLWQQDVVRVEGGEAGTMHVQAIDMRYKRAGRNYILITEVTIVDDAGDPVSSATVDVAFEFPTGNGAFKSSTTGADGTVTIRVRAKTTGIYVSTVVDVEHGSLLYVPEDNVETGETLAIP